MRRLGPLFFDIRLCFECKVVYAAAIWTNVSCYLLANCVVTACFSMFCEVRMPVLDASCCQTDL